MTSLYQYVPVYTSPYQSIPVCTGSTSQRAQPVFTLAQDSTLCEITHTTSSGSARAARPRNRGDVLLHAPAAPSGGGGAPPPPRKRPEGRLTRITLSALDARSVQKKNIKT